MPTLYEKMKKAGLLREEGGMVRMRTFGPSLTRRQFGALAAGAAGAAALGAGRAQAGEVKFMGWQGYEEAFAANGFAASKDITVAPTYQADNGQAMTSIANGGIGNMDIVTPDTGYTRVMAELDMLEPLDISRIPNWDGLDPYFKSIDNIVMDGKPYAVPYAWTIIPLMYTPATISEAPTSWMDVMKPEYKGKVGLTNDMISMVANFTIAVTGKKQATIISKAELAEVFAFMTELKKTQARTVAASYGELTDLLASGEVWIAQGWVPVQLWAKEKGADVRWTIPKEGAFCPIDCMAMVKGSPNMDDTYTLLDAAISPEGQAHAANINATGVTNAAAVAMLSEQVLEIQPHDDIAAFYETATGGQPLPLWPLEADGDLATLDDVLDAWDRFMAA